MCTDLSDQTLGGFASLSTGEWSVEGLGQCLEDVLNDRDALKAAEGLKLKQMLMGGVSQMLRVYIASVAPNERNGTAWRGTKAKGKVRMQALSDLITKKYEPVLFAVMHRVVDQDMELSAALDEVESLRDPSDWKFIKRLPELDTDASQRYKQRLLDPEFEKLVLSSAANPTPVATPSLDAPPPPDASMAPFAPLDDGITRYLALDPALSCGWAVIHLDASNRITSIDVGVIDVSDKSFTTDGLRCRSLREQLQPLLSPLPDHVFMELYVGHGRQGDAISYKLRGVIEMELASRDINYTEVYPQTWKKGVADNGSADKDEVRDAIVRRFQFNFPDKLYIRGKWLKFRDDASDATGIGLWGVAERHSDYQVAPTFTISAPGEPRARFGQRFTPPPVAALAPPPAAPLAVQSTEPLPVELDPNMCTLVDGCTLRVNHTGLCKTCMPGARTPPRVDYGALSGRKRSSPGQQGSAKKGARA